MRPMAPALAAPYSDTRMGRPTRPASEAMVMTRPQPRSHMPGSAVWVQFMTP